MSEAPDLPTKSERTPTLNAYPLSQCLDLDAGVFRMYVEELGEMDPNDPMMPGIPGRRFLVEFPVTSIWQGDPPSGTPLVQVFPAPEEPSEPEPEPEP